MTKVAIITEGYRGTGYGHLTRCLSIYQAFEEKGIIPLFIANCDEEGKEFIPDVNLLQINWLQEKNHLSSIISGFDIAIIDSYLAPLDIYGIIYNAVKKTVYVDDYIRLKYPPGTILNGTIGAENLPYEKDLKHEYLLGIEYMPLRKEFWDVEIPSKNINKIQNVLITFGAQDFRNLTPKVLGFLNNEFPEMNYNVVVSKNFIPEIEKDNITYYQTLNARDMLKVMLDSDIAITAAGQTTYELARIGLPMIAVGIAENQKYNLSGFVKEGIIDNEIWYNDEGWLEKIKSQINSIDRHFNYRFIDGHSSRRISERLLQ